ncbi:MAG: YggS family pyridoxal phosphate-dependent enzyme [Erysipelotrichaceae bacterium]|nr:YggS family pyridoxal phosphate-dependent enzyme [Erysipelotrichaceae bacterium]
MNAELIEKIQNMPGVKLVAVSKKHTKAEVDEMAALGVDTFGENRVQEFLEKYDPAYHWHIIGHLQTNKVKYIVGKVDLIESVDSLRLAREIEKQAAKAGIVQDILIEIKVSKTDENKTGLPEEELPELLSALAEMPHLRLKGLMTIATQTDDQQLLAQEFDHMKKLFEQIQKDFKDADTLSMGMSSDYELAIAHGSNQVRIGTALFA